MLTKFVSRLFLCCLFLVSTPTLAEKIVLATGDWPPYVSEDLKHQGVTARIVREAFRLAGEDVEFQYYPWKRALILSEKGAVDGTFPWSLKPERAEDHLYSDPIGDYGYVIFHFKSKPFDWETIEDLKPYKIGGTNGYNYGNAFLTAAKNGDIRVEWAPSDDINWQLLLKGRIDLFPSDREAGYTKLRELFLDEEVALVTHHPIPLKPLTPLHLLLPKSNPLSEQRLEQFNKGLAILKERGRYHALLKELEKGLYDQNIH
ncbi:MAG: transporter substrate-binding domain-containing protein [Oleiphilaceae bacterium]|nr:transporter substrate-binding domain-containing protein [Oleiphilaceae bacterium]